MHSQVSQECTDTFYFKPACVDLSEQNSLKSLSFPLQEPPPYNGGGVGCPNDHRGLIPILRSNISLSADSVDSSLIWTLFKNAKDISIII